jgi:hypothetical protein
MEVDMKSISYQAFQFLKSAKLRRLVRVAKSLTSNQSLLVCDQLSGDCTCDRQRQHSPNCGPHRDFVELHDQSKLPVPCNKHSVHHRAQIMRVWKVELHDGKEFEQT